MSERTTVRYKVTVEMEHANGLREQVEHRVEQSIGPRPIKRAIVRRWEVEEYEPDAVVVIGLAMPMEVAVMVGIVAGMAGDPCPDAELGVMARNLAKIALVLCERYGIDVVSGEDDDPGEPDDVVGG